MRIACVVDELFPSRDTLTVQVTRTLSALVRQGAQVDLYLPRSPWSPHPDLEALHQELADWYQDDCGFRLHSLPGLLPGPRAFAKLTQALLALPSSSSKSYDLLYVRIVLPLLGGLLRGLPTLFETYRPLTQQFPLARTPLRLLAQRPSFLGLVTHSEYCRRSFLEDGLPSEKLRCIYNGFDERAFASSQAPHEARAALGMREAPTFAYAGRLSAAKQIGLLLEAAERLPQYQLNLIGDADSSEAQEICSWAERLPNVSLRGYLRGTALSQAISAADVLVIPPSCKPLEEVGNTVLPIKLFQYLAAGRAILTGEVPDTEELLIQEETALRVQPDDVGALVRGLKRLMEEEVLRQGLARRARARSQDLSWDARAERLSSFMEERLSLPR